jgi:hypothetical protein
MKRAVIFLYNQNGYINIPCDYVMRTESDETLFYKENELVAGFQNTDLKGFYLNEKKECEQ